MTKVKGHGSILIPSFDGKSKSLFPSMKATKFFAGTRNLVLLSIVGNDYCRGDYLGAIVTHSVEKHEFTTFLIADEIYWHNLKISATPTPDELRILKNSALELGEQYFEEQCSQFLKPLGIDSVQFQKANLGKTVKERIAIINERAREYGFEILFWTDWVARTPGHIQQKTDDIFNLYSSEHKLKRSLHEQADNFARRHSKQTEGPDYDLCYMRSQGYLREESFYIIWLSAGLNYNFIVYPGDMPKPFAATREYFVKSTDITLTPNEIYVQSDKPERLANWLEVNYTRKPGLQDLAKPSSQGSVFQQSPYGKGLGLKPGNITPYNGPNFFVKPKPEDKNIVDDEQIATLAGITRTVLESGLSFELKADFILYLVNCLSMDVSPMELDSGSMVFI